MKDKVQELTIKNLYPSLSKEELKEWIDKRKANPSLNKKFFHILRKYSSEAGEDMLVCKMRGAFYVISGQSAYNIVFVHAIKIKIHKLMAGK